MITLSGMRERVTARLAETSDVFWTEADRNRAINDAVRFIASLTKGVTKKVTSPGSPTLVIPHSQVGFRGSWGEWNGHRLPSISVEEAQVLDSRFPLAIGTPRWVVFDVPNSTVHLYPQPTTDTRSWSVQVAALPRIVADTDSDTRLFDGVASMEKFTNATDLLACAYLLLQERFDNDAERFYQMGIQELAVLGVDSNSIPPLQAGLGPQGGNA